MGKMANEYYDTVRWLREAHGKGLGRRYAGMLDDVEAKLLDGEVDDELLDLLKTLEDNGAQSVYENFYSHARWMVDKFSRLEMEVGFE